MTRPLAKNMPDPDQDKQLPFVEISVAGRSEIDVDTIQDTAIKKADIRRRRVH